MELQRRTAGDAAIPTSSMADIAFLLIIFFMVTAVFSATKGLDMQLPRQRDEPTRREPVAAVLIRVDREGIRVDCAPMGLDEILPYLEPRLRRNPDKPVILFPDPGVEYRRVVEIYDLLAGTRSGDSARDIVVRDLSVPTRGDIAEYVEMFGVNPLETHCR